MSVFASYGVWQSFATTAVGWGSPSPAQFQYMIIGKTVYFQICYEGTSNSTSTTFTLPVAASTNITTHEGNIGFGQDNGGTLGAGPRWEIVPGTNASLMTCLSTAAGNVWTATGTKVVRFQGLYQTA